MVEVDHSVLGLLEVDCQVSTPCHPQGFVASGQICQVALVVVEVVEVLPEEGRELFVKDELGCRCSGTSSAIRLKHFLWHRVRCNQLILGSKS